MRFVPKALIDDGLMQAGMSFILVNDFADINWVIDHPIDITLIHKFSLPGVSFLTDICLGAKASIMRFMYDGGYGTRFSEPFKNLPDDSSFRLINDQLPVFN